MSIWWPNADYPRTAGGEADLFDAEAIVDSEVFDVEPYTDPEAVVYAQVASLALRASALAFIGGVHVSWYGAPAYTPPLGDAVDVSWAPAEVEGYEATVAATVASLSVTMQAIAEAPVVYAATFAAEVARLGVGGSVEARVGASAAISGTVTTLEILPEITAGVGAQGTAGAQVAVLNLTGIVTAQLAVTATAAATVSTLGILPNITAQHPRYELRGLVKLAGNPVNRRVRAYDRATGELVGQVDTVDGFFCIPAGFSSTEYTVLPIDLDSGATDYEPPVANRVLCVMAEDAP